MPDASTLCRRQETVAIQTLFRRAGGDLALLVDSAGVTMRGDGESQDRKCLAPAGTGSCEPRSVG